MDAWTEQDRQQFAERLQRSREKSGMKQDDVGAMFEKGKAAVSAWERGRNMPSAEQVARLAAEFRVSVEWLLFGVEAQPLSLELRARLARLDPDAMRRLENSIRAQFDMPQLPSAAAAPSGLSGKPPAQLAA